MITYKDYELIEKVIEECFGKVHGMVLGGGSTPTGIYVPMTSLFLPTGNSVSELKVKILDKVKELVE